MKTVKNYWKKTKQWWKNWWRQLKLPSIDTFGNKESKDFGSHFKMRLTHSLKDFKRNKQFINSWLQNH
jgi:hypothetical protein